MDRKGIARDTERVIHKYMKNEEIRRSYGTDSLLTRKEIHTIQLIGDYPGMNLCTLAAHHGVTKGAASQMVGRLREKGFLERRTSESSLAEIALNLTAKGQQAFQGHWDYHSRMDTVWKKAFSDLTEQDMAVIERFLLTVEQILDEEGEDMK